MQNIVDVALGDCDHTVILSRCLGTRRRRAAGIEIPNEVLSGMSSYWTEHLNRFGMFQLDMENLMYAGRDLTNLSLTISRLKLWRMLLLGMLLLITCPILANTEATCDRYLDPTAHHLQTAKDVFKQFFLGHKPSQADLLAIDLSYQKVDTTHWLLDNNAVCSGHGHYYFSNVSSDTLLLEAPHQYDDLYTGDILRKLLSENPRAAAWNSVDRHIKDETNENLSYLLVFTQVFLEHFPTDWVVQLHGFSKKKRRAETAHVSDVIVSEGIEHPSAQLYQLAQCLRTALSTHTLVYPTETRELGATKNRVGQWVNHHYPSHFVHIEMSLSIRKQLVQSKDTRKRLILCLRALR